MPLTSASRSFFLTSTRTFVPFLWCPLLMYPMAMLVPRVGDGMPEVMTPIWVSGESAAKTFAPSARPDHDE